MLVEIIFHVSKFGTLNFERNSEAVINSVTKHNERWIQIGIAAGVYQCVRPFSTVTYTYDAILFIS